LLSRSRHFGTGSLVRMDAVTTVQSAHDKRMHQLLHDLAVDVLSDFSETAQLKEVAAGDTSNMFTGRQLDRHL